MRARINVLSEVPAAWAAAVRRWRAHRTAASSATWTASAAPDRNDEYLLYQTLLGAWPAEDDDDAARALIDRIAAYMEKATKEAKVHTSWINPNAGTTQAVRDFVTRLLAPGSPFLDAFRPSSGWSPARLRSTRWPRRCSRSPPRACPTSTRDELWDLSLVDPDNRRPVDFALRQRLLDDLQQRAGGPPESLQAFCTELMNSWRDGRVKMYVTLRGLTLRKDYPALFRAGTDHPLPAGGERAGARRGAGPARPTPTPWWSWYLA